MLLDCGQFNNATLGVTYKLSDLVITQVERKTINPEREFDTKKAVANKCNSAFDVADQFRKSCLWQEKCNMVDL